MAIINYVLVSLIEVICTWKREDYLLLHLPKLLNDIVVEVKIDAENQLPDDIANRFLLKSNWKTEKCISTSISGSSKMFTDSLFIISPRHPSVTGVTWWTRKTIWNAEMDGMNSHRNVFRDVHLCAFGFPPTRNDFHARIVHIILQGLNTSVSIPNIKNNTSSAGELKPISCRVLSANLRCSWTELFRVKSYILAHRMRTLTMSFAWKPSP